jgi:glycerophosphoryl diester phosphodiesterase
MSSRTPGGSPGRIHPALESSRPLVFAHRGGAGLAPENTIGAFEHAAALHVDGFELDLQLSHDGVAMVHHDRTLDRTTNGTGPLDHLTSAELMALDAAYRFKPEEGFPWRGRAGGVPRLRDVLARFPQHRFVIEIKGTDRRLLDTAVEDIRAAGAIDRVTVGAYAARQMWRARQVEPRLATGAAYEETRWALYRSWIRWPAANPRYRVFHVPEMVGQTRVVSPAFINDAHRRHVHVYVWTVNTAEDIRRLLAWGVDAIITDRPDIAVPIVGIDAASAGGGASALRADEPRIPTP